MLRYRVTGCEKHKKNQRQATKPVQRRVANSRSKYGEVLFHPRLEFNLMRKKSWFFSLQRLCNEIFHSLNSIEPNPPFRQ
jgi:hypothetical protein